jgi:chromosome segregation ATPase
MITMNKQARSILKGLLDTFDAIDQVNGLEQREAQLNASIATLTAQEDAETKRIAERREEAQRLLDDAAAELAQAKAKAEQIVAQADANAQKITDAAQAAAAKAKASENASEAAERRAKKNLAELGTSIATAQQNLAAINLKIEAAKADARARFGG